MVKLGLTGNRYSGKDVVSRLFEQISIPVFNADIVLKFLLQYQTDVNNQIKVQLGNSVFLNDGFIDARKFNTTEKFNRLVSIAEPELFNAYKRFNLKNSDAIYTIFHSSIIFEKSWEKKLDGVINVFAPKDTRIGRSKKLSGLDLSTIYNLISFEMDELDKNKKSTYIIHNYDDAIESTTQVDSIDTKIVDKYLNKSKSLNYSNTAKNILQ